MYIISLWFLCDIIQSFNVYELWTHGHREVFYGSGWFDSWSLLVKQGKVQRMRSLESEVLNNTDTHWHKYQDTPSTHGIILISQIKGIILCIREINLANTFISNICCEQQCNTSLFYTGPVIDADHHHEIVIILLFNIRSGESANAVPHYQKLCNRDSHIWGIRRGQYSRSAMAIPRPGWTTFLIMVSPLPGKYELYTARGADWFRHTLLRLMVTRT